jgi:5'-nucleotidase/UDP-sugar diphosphatase
MRHRFAFAVLAACVCATCSQSQQYSLTILHTNDMHASFVPHEAFWVRETPKPLVGGFKELAFVVDSIRKATRTTLLLDAGDVMTGNPVCDMEYAGAQGGALFVMMNMIGYEAWSIGNHDFDISQENLRNLTKIPTFPTLSANVVNSEGAYPVNNKPYAVVEKDGLKIGIIGVMSQDLYHLVNQNSLVGIRVLDPVATTQHWIDELKSRTDVIIALTHQGVDEDSILAVNVTGLNIIVGGHSHTRLRQPKLVNGVVIVQAGSNCENLGVLQVTVENQRVVRYDGRLIQLWYHADRPATRLSTFIDSLQQEIDKEYDQVIATLKTDWRKTDGESGLGNFVVDAQRDAAHADIAFMNTSGIRAGVSAGPLTKKALFEVMPFRNTLTTFQLSGKDVRSVVAYCLRSQRAAVVFSGLTGRWRRNAAREPEIVSIEVGGKPLDDKRMYICAASDYFVGEAQRYIGMEILQPTYLQQTVFSVLETAARRAAVIESKVENRIQEIP